MSVKRLKLMKEREGEKEKRRGRRGGQREGREQPSAHFLSLLICN
jgi:hypothetical protein